ncbi:HesA/MoeB/ThiF family protein [Novispirillum itersonii]|uniref:Molybdopterin-synthase adenylyltransferase n=1 Tax=Novispirillum itersonii TaxID=189 RepID=A0A7W9ZFS3_NOVIT|nr:molybdopterin-synthase adenylyltransferase MoeB [Novispirillum itersonii]MBB6210696.1 adenylyltransferase/sulfurtransferase [Novispirillum itersonii]
MSFSEEQIRRYARHILLPNVGGTGQEKLLASKVLLIGAGGLGSPLAVYLAAAGVGTIGIVDDDTVDLSNLQRQIAHTTDRIGMAKTASAAQAMQAINPDITVHQHRMRLDAGNAAELFAGYDLIADGSDNFGTRFLVNDAAFFARKTLVSAAILRFDGQLSTYKPHAGGPCYRCIFREPPPPGQIPSCAEAGILGAVAGVMGTLQATEILKELLGIGDSMAGRLMIYDGLSAAFRTVRVKPDPGCPLCGPAPTITHLQQPEEAPACGLP